MNNVIATKVIISRNLKDFKFTSKISEEEKQLILKKVDEALKGKMSLLNINQLDVQVFKHLKGQDLILNSSQNLFVGKRESLAINMFSGEHVSIVSTCDGFNKIAVTNAVELSQTLSDKIQFAYNDEMGYLMSDLNNVGSGIKLESVIMLSAITKINKVEQLKQNLSKLGYSLKETKYPAVYTLSTKCNLGISEKKIFEDFESTLSKLQELEIESVKMLDATNHDEMLDKVNRSVAILNSANLLNYDELFNIIVNLRMGVNIGLINLSSEVINKLQNLISSKTNDMVAQSELKELAQKAKAILKGESNV